MERETDKHSPRIDDAMAGDVRPLVTGAGEEARSREERLQEDPDVGPGRDPRAGEAVGLGVSAPAADERAELARHLADVRFPARLEDLVDAAEADHAPTGLVSRLRALGEQGPFENVQRVWAALGGETEDAHTA